MSFRPVAARVKKLVYNLGGYYVLKFDFVKHSKVIYKNWLRII
jgi:hypothetical protein